MVDPIVQQLERGRDCKYLLGCLFDVTELDKRCYEYIHSNGPAENPELANALERDKSTTNRSLQRLEEAGLIEREKVTYDGGGYKHVYKQRDPQEVRSEMDETIEDWLDMVEGLLDEFEEDFS